MPGLAVWLTAVAAAVLWMSLFAPWFISRHFGATCAFGFWSLDRAESRLTHGQFVWWFGVFTFGVGIFLYGAVFDILRIYLLHEDLSLATNSLGGSVTALVVGSLIGWISAPRQQRKGTD